MKHASRSQLGFAHIGIIILVVVVIASVAAVGLRIMSKDDKGVAGSLGDWVVGCEGDERARMTHMPMDIDDVKNIQPLGLVAGAHVTPIDHLYFYPQDGPRDKYPVYAMADGFIKEIQVREVNVSSGESRPPEYRILMQHSCQTLSYFDLVTKLDKSILDQAPKAASEGFHGTIAIKSGQEIGRIGAQSLDTAIYNTKLTLTGFIHPDMYKGEPWKIHTEDFFSYFDDSLNAAMQTKNARKAQPVSGKIDYDQPGKLIGNWFKEGSGGYDAGGNMQVGSSGAGYWSGHLAIFYDPIDPTKVVISIGSFKNNQPEAFYVKDNTPDPATIDTSSGVVTYELTQAGVNVQPGTTLSARVLGTILFQVQPGEKLKVQVFPDKTAAQVTGFTSGTVMYER